MVGAHGAEVVKVVGEMAEVAVEALEWRHERKVEKDIAKEWDWAEVESDLDCQRRDNQRLRATIAMYEQAFQQLHKEKADSGNLSVERSLAVSFSVIRKLLRVIHNITKRHAPAPFSGESDCYVA
jgi:hypothetical protein